MQQRVSSPVIRYYLGDQLFESAKRSNSEDVVQRVAYKVLIPIIQGKLRIEEVEQALPKMRELRGVVSELSSLKKIQKNAPFIRPWRTVALKIDQLYIIDQGHISGNTTTAVQQNLRYIAERMLDPDLKDFISYVRGKLPTQYQEQFDMQLALVKSEQKVACSLGQGSLYQEEGLGTNACSVITFMAALAILSGKEFKSPADMYRFAIDEGVAYQLLWGNRKLGFEDEVMQEHPLSHHLQMQMLDPKDLEGVVSEEAIEAFAGINDTMTPIPLRMATKQLDVVFGIMEENRKKTICAAFTMNSTVDQPSTILVGITKDGKPFLLDSHGKAKMIEFDSLDKMREWILKEYLDSKMNNEMKKQMTAQNKDEMRDGFARYTNKTFSLAILSLSDQASSQKIAKRERSWYFKNFRDALGASEEKEIDTTSDDAAIAEVLSRMPESTEKRRNTSEPKKSAAPLIWAAFLALAAIFVVQVIKSMQQQKPKTRKRRA